MDRSSRDDRPRRPRGERARLAPRRSPRAGAPRVRLTAFALPLTLTLAACGNREPIVEPPRLLGNDLNAAGLRYWRLGELDLAESAFRRALEASEAVDHLAGEADALYNLALLHRERASDGTTESELASAENLYREIDDAAGITRCLLARSDLHLARGELATAGRRIEEARASAPDALAAEVLVNLAALRLAQGETEAAAAAAAEAAEAAEAASDERVRADALALRARALERAERLTEAASALGEVLELDRRLDRRPAIAMTLRELARLARKRGDSASAEAYRKRALGVERALGGEPNVENASAGDDAPPPGEQG